MKNLNNMVGNIKRIKAIMTTKTKTVDAMITGYVYNPNTTFNKQHKLEYITVQGEVSSMFVNENTEFEGIEVSTHVSEILSKMKDTVNAKKEAYERYLKERDNLNNLTIQLLQEENILTREEFEEKLTRRLESEGVKFYSKESSKGQMKVVYKLNDYIWLGTTLKKQYLKEIRLELYKPTGKKAEEFDFVKKYDDSRRLMQMTDMDSYLKFKNEYRILDLTNQELKAILKENEFLFEENIVMYSGKDGNVEVKNLGIGSRKKSGGKVLLNDDAIDFISRLLDFVSC